VRAGADSSPAFENGGSQSQAGRLAALLTIGFVQKAQDLDRTIRFGHFPVPDSSCSCFGRVMVEFSFERRYGWMLSSGLVEIVPGATVRTEPLGTTTTFAYFLV